jgi:hypothetical protein
VDSNTLLSARALQDILTINRILFAISMSWTSVNFVRFREAETETTL